jgi:hypothetical protein
MRYPATGIRSGSLYAMAGFIPGQSLHRDYVIKAATFLFMDDRKRIANRVTSLLAEVSMTADGIHEFFVDSSSRTCYDDERRSILRYIFIGELAEGVTEKEHPFLRFYSEYQKHSPMKGE